MHLFNFLDSQSLDRTGFHHVEEHVIHTEDLRNEFGIELSERPLEFLSIDIANVEDKIGVEVDGPGHFINLLDFEGSERETVKHNNVGLTGRRQVNGPTEFKDRMLRALGWRIEHVPFWEWRELDGNKEKEDLYTANLMKEFQED
jgi:hypothetical protein